jgi:hypothetical protein
VRSSVSIALFFLLSGFFLFALLAALEHSRRAVAVAVACLAAVVCIIVFLTPVRLPDWLPGQDDEKDSGGTSTTIGVTSTTLGSTRTTLDPAPIAQGWTAITLNNTLTTYDDITNGTEVDP